MSKREGETDGEEKKNDGQIKRQQGGRSQVDGTLGKKRGAGKEGGVKRLHSVTP